MEQSIIEQRYHEACARACARSQEFACTVYVQAVLTLGTETRVPSIQHYTMSDWYCGATVATFTEGKRHEV